MPSIFSRLKGQKNKPKKGLQSDLINQQPPKPRWDDAWSRTTVEPEEMHELIKRCTEEIKARALDHPFLLLPFRPTSDPSAVRTFVRHFFDNNALRGEMLVQEIRMTEPMVISGAIKWCWSRLQGGVVGWDSYELFKVGEQDSNMARDSFKTFIPLSVDNGARSSIIFDFFDLLSAIAAHGKMNGFGGRKLSRMAAWWAFEHQDNGNGFDDGYKQWLKAADATSHLFFAYLRTLAPQQQSRGGIAMLPNSLQKLLQETEYPPQRPSLMQSTTHKVVMVVDAVSPTPFALLRRGNHFQYRDEDSALQQFSEYEDPVAALTEECRRVLRAVSAANQTQAVSSSKHSTSLRDASWSRFEDIGFTSALDEEEEAEAAPASQQPPALRKTPASAMNLGRPTTPSWADFLSSGFVDDGPNSPSHHLLPPDKVLPPIDTNVRQKSSQSHKPRLQSDHYIEAGELASITKFSLDDAFWWVWMASLAPEETMSRKSVFGRCAVIETVIRNGRWLVMEEVVKGAAPDIEEGAYVAEKKGFFSWTRRNKDKGGVSRSKSAAGKNVLAGAEEVRSSSAMGFSKSSIGPDQQAKISAAAQQLQMRQEREKAQAAKNPNSAMRRGRTDADIMAQKTNSVFTLRPVIMNEASPAMKWANKYDKEAIREAYLANQQAGRGIGQSTMQTNGHAGAVNGYGGRPETPSPLLPPQSPSVPPKDVSISGRNSPMPPPKDDHPTSLELMRENNYLPPEPPVESSPESKKNQKKLHKEKEKKKQEEKLREKEMKKEKEKKEKEKKEKEKKEGGGGFGKLFGRGRRASKLPENATADLNVMLAAQRDAAATPEPALKSEMPRQETQFATPQSKPTDPMPPTEAAVEPQYDPSVHDEVSRIDTSDEQEARHEFSRFDQGPLDDQPAFAPQEDTDEEEDDAVPPPITRNKSASVHETELVSPIDETAKPLSGQDRWAKIRKNAQDRAAQRQSEEQSRGGHSKTTDGEDDTSGEETIESRVARIKARVAELTGNMEGVHGPGGNIPVRR